MENACDVTKLRHQAIHQEIVNSSLALGTKGNR